MPSFITGRFSSTEVLRRPALATARLAAVPWPSEYLALMTVKKCRNFSERKIQFLFCPLNF
jgi:hypothetical protein